MMLTAITVKRVILCLVVFCCYWKAIPVSAYPLTDAQKARLEKVIPHTFAKLQRHEPIHILTLGDSVTEMFTPDVATNHDYLHAYHARFADLMCREFFYPGGVRLLNPAKGKPDKANKYLGDEITIENFGLEGRASFDSIQRITTDAFLNEPDLMIIQYGINDAIMGLSIDMYRQSIQLCIDECRKRGVDVMLLGPTMVRISEGPLEWGIEREYALVARELAAKNKVFYMDMGQVIGSTSGVRKTMDAKEAIRVVADKIGKRFEFVTPPKELLHPNLPSHLELGKALFDELLNGEPSNPFRVQARAIFKDQETIEVKLTIKNGGIDVREGSIGALTHRRVFVPTEGSAFQNYRIDPGKSATFSFTYKRQNTLTRGDAKPRYQSLDPGEPRLLLSYLVADSKGSRVLDVAPLLEPVAVTWKEGQQLGVRDGIRLDWRFVNGRNKPVSGSYDIKMGERKASGKFELKADGVKDFFAEFPINEKDDVLRFKEEVELRVKVGGKEFVFFREVEATRDLYLGEKVAMAHDEYYTVGVRSLRTVEAAKKAIYFRADADQNDLYLTFDLEGIQLLKIPSGLSMVVEVSIDGRPQKGKQAVWFC